MSDNLAIQLYGSISEENEVRDFKHWHASSIAECPRAHYFKRQGMPPLTVPTAAKMLRWQAGHLIEEVIRPHLKKLYPDLKSNVRITSEKLDLTGEYDNYSKKEKTIFEIKSVHVFAFNTKGTLRDDTPYLNHEYQNHAYKLLLEENNLPLDYITYVYITLDGRICTYKEPIKETILDNVKKRLEILKNASDSNLPPCLCDESHPLWKSTMQYCDFCTETTKCSIDRYMEWKNETVQA